MWSTIIPIFASVVCGLLKSTVGNYCSKSICVILKRFGQLPFVVSLNYPSLLESIFSNNPPLLLESMVLHATHSPQIIMYSLIYDYSLFVTVYIWGD